MQDILIQIDQLVSELKSLQPVKEEYQRRLDKKFRLEFNYNSNHIEGNTLTYGNTELLLIFDKISGDYDAREIEEMKAHDVALAMIKELATDKERDLTESFIRQLNELILVRPFWKEALTADGQQTRRLIEPGNYKKYPNSVRLQNGEMFDYASPEETPALMGDLMEFYKSNADKHPLWQAAMMHYKFVRIHPFDDGNGRVARLLMNYIILKHDLPPVIIKSSDKKGYLTTLNKADSGDMDSFISYIAQQEIWSLDISIKAARGENIDEADDLDKKIELLKRDLIKEDVVQNESSQDLTLEALHNNIIPIISNVQDKCESFRNFFVQGDIRVSYALSNIESYFGAENGADLLNLLKSKFDDMIFDGAVLRSINYNYSLKGFKKNVNAWNCSIFISITFNRYNYIIKAEQVQTQLIVPYGKILSEDERRIFYTPLIEDLIETIDRYNRQ